MFRFTIRDVLWLTLVVAAFLGGRYWDQMADFNQRTPAVIPPGIITLSLTAGDYLTVNASVPVKRMLVGDPTILSIVQTTQDSFELQANETGITTVAIWDDSMNPPITYEVTVQ